MRQTVGSFYHAQGFQKFLSNKLAYEWKNIYRQLCLIDADDLGVLRAADFLRACNKHGIEFSKRELIKVIQHFPEDEMSMNIEYTVDNEVLADCFINYKRISMQLGLHKDSFNYLN